MPLRRLLLAVPVVALIAATAPAGAQTPPPALVDRVRGGNVMPPGNTGHVPATELATALQGDYAPPNASDQRDLYVSWGRKDWSFATPDGKGGAGKDAIGPAYAPAGRTDVSIRRDGWGVPRIFGKTDEGAQFGVGYAMAQDRLFQADIFRHVARGEMAEFLGGQEWFDYDRAWRQEFYTDAELLDMMNRFYDKREQALLQAYLDGINAYIDEALRDPRKLPAEYAALQIVPQKWELRHSLAIFVLQARDSVEGFGKELYNAAFLADLEKRHGKATARRIFGDVRFYRDPGAYTTARPEEGRFPYPGGGFEGFDAPGVRVPDAGPALTAAAERDAAILRALENVGLARRQASNAITVTDDKAAGGRPILLGGPQLDYLAPGIFWEFEIQSPSQQARGIGFAGTAGVVLIGKTPRHSWSITYGYTDQIDTFLVPLDPARPTTHYLRGGQSRPLQAYTSTVRCRTYAVGLADRSPAGDTCDGLPVSSASVNVQRVPEYGPVIGRVPVGGKPHAVVKVRGHWMREIANGKPFLAFNRAKSIAEFRAAQTAFTISLNVNYVDDRGNAGFWHVAKPPVRAKGTDVRLPTIGDGRFDWRGFVPLDAIPHAINPRQGFTANWNNQVGTGWHNGDENYWGDLQRVEMLSRRMEALAARGRITPDEIWRVNREAAFEDGRWHDFVPLLTGAHTGAQPAGVAGAALAEVRKWDGQRTATKGTDGTWRYDDAATTIFDEFVQQLQRAVLADDVGNVYYDGAKQLGPKSAPAHYHLYSTLLLKILLGDRAPLRAQHDWLNKAGRDPVIRSAFAAAVEKLDKEHEGPPSTWRGRAVLTSYRSLGLLGVEAHPFLNRGTYNQLAVVDVVRSGAPASRGGVPAPAAAPGTLPTTGGPLGVAEAALALLALAGLGALGLRAGRRRPVS